MTTPALAVTIIRIWCERSPINRGSLHDEGRAGFQQYLCCVFSEHFRTLSRPPPSARQFAGMQWRRLVSSFGRGFPVAQLIHTRTFWAPAPATGTDARYGAPTVTTVAFPLHHGLYIHILGQKHTAALFNRCLCHRLNGWSGSIAPVSRFRAIYRQINNGGANWIFSTFPSWRCEKLYRN